MNLHVSIFLVPGLQVYTLHTAGILAWIEGIELKSLCLHSNTLLTTSSPRPVRILSTWFQPIGCGWVYKEMFEVCTIETIVWFSESHGDLVTCIFSKCPWCLWYIPTSASLNHFCNLGWKVLLAFRVTFLQCSYFLDNHPVKIELHGNLTKNKRKWKTEFFFMKIMPSFLLVCHLIVFRSYFFLRTPN